jgi:hypothetical protein
VALVVQSLLELEELLSLDEQLELSLLLCPLQYERDGVSSLVL